MSCAYGEIILHRKIFVSLSLTAFKRLYFNGSIVIIMNGFLFGQRKLTQICIWKLFDSSLKYYFLHYLTWYEFLLQTLLTRSSPVLSSVLGGKAYFQSFSVVLPLAWSRYHPGVDTVSGLQGRGGDIIVTSGHGPPYVDRDKGCANQAKRLLIPKQFLDSSSNSTVEKSRIAHNFVDRWIDFRQAS